MWDLPEPGMEPMSPALAGKFLNPAPPGKSPKFHLEPKTNSNKGTCCNLWLYLFSQLISHSFSLIDVEDSYAVVRYKIEIPCILCPFSLSYNSLQNNSIISR